MGFRFNKRIKIMPGLTMNVSKSGIGYSAGGKGVRVTKRADGRVTRTISAPGTGLSHTRTVSGGAAKTSTRTAAPRPARPAVVTPPPPPRPPQPGVLAPRWEKDLFSETSNSRSNDYAQVAAKHPDAPGLRVLCATVEGLWHFTRLNTGSGDPRRARALLGWAAANGSGDLGRHPFVTKYLAERTWPVEIAGGVVAHLTLEQDVALLAAAELHQTAGDLEAAIWVVEQAEPTTAAALSLAELYSDAGRDDEVVDLTNGLTNEDDATALLLVLRGRAFAQQGLNDAARLALKEAMRVRSRPAEIRHRALLERAGINLAQNKKAAARKDIETVYSEDPTYPGVREALAALPT